MTIEATLAERGNRYGEFKEHARITQNLKRAMVDSPNWSALPDDMKEALEMVAHKIGRILNGDPAYADSWHDIIGYTKLVEKELEGPLPPSPGLPNPFARQPATAKEALEQIGKVNKELEELMKAKHGIDCAWDRP